MQPVLWKHGRWQLSLACWHSQRSRTEDDEQGVLNRACVAGAEENLGDVVSACLGCVGTVETTFLSNARTRNSRYSILSTDEGEHVKTPLSGDNGDGRNSSSPCCKWQPGRALAPALVLVLTNVRRGSPDLPSTNSDPSIRIPRRLLEEAARPRYLKAWSETSLPQQSIFSHMI